MTSRTMTGRVEEYLAYRHALGSQIRVEGQLLRSFARFADEAGHAGPLTTDLALRWARLRDGAARLYQARRLEVVRPLAKYLAVREPGTEIPPRGLLGPAHARREPFLYTETQVAALLAAAQGLGPPGGLRPHTYRTLLGLLACTGLRIREALTLETADVEWAAGMLNIRRSKFRKSRLTPLHDSAVEPLRAYAAERDKRFPERSARTFFVCGAGRPLPYGTVRHTFHRLLERALPGVVPVGRPRPRFHDLRHTFACRCLLGWYRDGIDIQRAIERLSTYLGHAKVSDTYWYLTSVPELFALAGARFESYAAGAGGGGR